MVSAQEPAGATPIAHHDSLTKGAATGEAIARYLSLPFTELSRKKLPVQLADQNISQVSPEEEKTRVALAIVESDISPEIILTRASDETSYRIDFEPHGVAIRSSKPRYDSLSSGISVAFAAQETKIAWFESKRDSSVLFIVPPLTECGTQFVLACPRMFTPEQELAPSGYLVTGARYIGSGKADGLFKAPEGTPGRVVARFTGSARMPLPTPSSVTTENIAAPRATIKAEKGALEQKGPANAELPFEEFLEGHLEFGTPDKILRTAHARSTVIVRRFDLPTAQEVPIENSTVTLQPGACFIVAQTKEGRF